MQFIEVDGPYLYKIALYQKRFLRSFLVALISILFIGPLFGMLSFGLLVWLNVLPANETGPVLGLGVLMGLTFLPFLCAMLWHLYCYFSLASSLGMRSVAILVYIIGLIVPFVSFLMLRSIIRKATKMLEDAGYKVGLLGADTEAIRVDIGDACV